MNWQTANRVAHLAATQAQDALGVLPGAFPVQTSAAIDAAGLSLMWRPLGQLFGLYGQAGDHTGILVNAGLTRSARRHTAAHELGHHQLGHKPNLKCAVDPEDGLSKSGPGWTATEKAAEAFAAWFLMPRRAVLAALTSLGLSRASRPAEVYQLSLLLGTSYRGTARHLNSLKMANWTESTEWARASPASLKQQLLAGSGVTLDSTLDTDVWFVPNAHGQTLYVSPGDLIVVRADQLIGSSDGLDQLADDPSAPLVLRCTASGSLAPELIEVSCAGTSAEIHVVVEPRPFGEFRPADLTHLTGRQEL